ncbi:MAG: choice-of-anchor Q domain-containing protein, partial [Planctomycetota bacterium]
VDGGAVTTIVRSTFTGNRSGDDGGAIELTGGTTMILEDSVFDNNYAYDRGGAMYLRGQDAVLDSNVTITGTTFQNNRAIDDGAGVHASPNVQMTIDDSDFTGNTAVSRGSAIRFSFAFDPGETSNALITNSRITGNSTDDDGAAGYVGQGFIATFDNVTIEDNVAGDGAGGFRTQAGGIMTINNSSISNNVSGNFGGAFHNIGSGTFGGSYLTVNNSTVAGNSAVNGGGAMDTTASAVTINNSTVSGNTTDGLGAGLYLELDPASANVYPQIVNSSTITGNVSQNYGGGIYVGYYTAPSINGSIVAGNSAANVANDIYETRGYFNVAFTLVGDNSGSTLVESALDANGNVIGGATNGVVDPMLGPLQDNGGPTLTHMPMAGSPVIEAGDPSIMDGTDQRGFDRVFDGNTLMDGGIVDMGSVEFGSMGSDDPSPDFDGDGDADCEDIDALQADIIAGTGDLLYDLTGDGLVDLADQTQWFADAATFNGFATPYQQADFNLDRVVDVSDFGIWNASKFTTTSAFCSGDANADGVVDVSDFGIWNSLKFTAADSALRGVNSHGVSRAEVRAMRAQSQLDDTDDMRDPIDDFQASADNDRVTEAQRDNGTHQSPFAVVASSLVAETQHVGLTVNFEAPQAQVAINLDSPATKYQQDDAADDNLRIAAVNEIFAEDSNWD